MAIIIPIYRKNYTTNMRHIYINEIVNIISTTTAKKIHQIPYNVIRDSI